MESYQVPVFFAIFLVHLISTSSARLMVRTQTRCLASESATSSANNAVSPAPSPPPERATPSEEIASQIESQSDGSRGGFGIPVAALLRTISETPEEEPTEVEESNESTQSGGEEVQNMDTNEEGEQDSMEQSAKIVTFIYDTDGKLKEWYKSRR